MTDHQSLKWLKTIENPTGRVARWGLYLQQFDFDIIYRKRKWNKVADALSKNEETSSTSNIEETVDSSILIANVKLDDWYDQVKAGVETQPQKYPEFRIINNNLYRHAYHSLDYSDRGDTWKLCDRKSNREKILQENHDEPTAGHLGIAKTIARISKSYYCPKMRAEITDYVRKCEKCQEYKPPPPKKKPTAGIMGTLQATQPWEVISVNIIGPKPRSSNGMSYAIVMQDKFTVD